VISVKNRKIFLPRVFGIHADGVPVEIGYRHSESKKRWSKSLS